ncbi:MAG: class I SAM-dependent methyltransferase [Balneolales bacterium]|nr:class I SAM-dependent methyltransferase [Balneolales bacterium]
MSTYYKEVASYYDDDARDFEQRYEVNPVLQRIRGDFRRVTEQHTFSRALEIGCGPGFDVEYFAQTYPDRHIAAIDVSPEMIHLASRKVKEAGLSNTSFAVGSVEQLASAFPDTRFDLVYVYFGGLNTVEDLGLAARHIAEQCTPGATLVLTFVNRYYLTEIPLWLANGRFDKAFERVNNRWRGYSDHRKIPSRPYSSRDIHKAFEPVADITYRRGYSLFFPAWYRSHLLKKLGNSAEKLWNIDAFLSRTPFWNMGEYSLYTMKVKGR